MTDETPICKTANEAEIIPQQRLGRLPAKASRKALMFSDFVKVGTVPKRTNFWKARTPIPLGSWGNDQFGSCTRSKQVIAAMRMERLERRMTIDVTPEEVIRVYLEMTSRLYGGGDTGAYEDDALSCWRKPDQTFRDTKGNPYTIDAYLRLNPFDHQQVRAAIALSGARGIAVCFNLPMAWSSVRPPADWTAPPAGTPLVGEFQPGSWGGHSMNMHDYDEVGGWVDHTWGYKPQRVTWEAMSVYMDEAHVVLDSLDAWRKLAAAKAKIAKLKVGDIIDAVNAASSYPIGG